MMGGGDSYDLVSAIYQVSPELRPVRRRASDIGRPYSGDDDDVYGCSPRLFLSTRWQRSLKSRKLRA